eukprot:jgi/Botrbrau1/21662/Bobra.43_1s0061.1
MSAAVEQRPANSQGTTSAASAYEQTKSEYENLWQNSSPVTKKKQKTFPEQCGSDTYIPASALERVRTLGKGSFSMVEVCRYNNGQEVLLVAVKRLKAGSELDLEDLINEAKILRKLTHRYITKFIGVGTVREDQVVDNRFKSESYLVQEYIDGGTLTHRLRSKAPYLYGTAAKWGRQLAEGLAYLHSFNPMVVHRDLKLDNILIRKGDGDVAICDFGLAVSVVNPNIDTRRSQLGRLLPTALKSRVATMMEAIEEGHPASEPDLEQKKSALERKMTLWTEQVEAGLVGQRDKALPPTFFDLTGMTGSYVYMAPEVTLCRPYNEKADVFSFAIIMYELLIRTSTVSMLIEKGVADIEQVEMYAQKVARGWRQPLPRWWPQELKELIKECWADRPGDRPSMAAVANRIKEMEATGVFTRMDATEHSRKGSSSAPSLKHCCVIC